MTPLRPKRTFCPRWSYMSANAELALNGLLRFGTALCTSVSPRGLFSSNTSHFVTRRVTPPRVPASSRPTRSHPRPPRARATRHNAAIERCIKIAPAARLGAAPRRPDTRPPRRRPPRRCAAQKRRVSRPSRSRRRLPQALALNTNGQDPVQEVRQGAQEGLRRQEEEEGQGVLLGLHLRGPQGLQMRGVIGQSSALGYLSPRAAPAIAFCVEGHKGSYRAPRALVG